MKKTLDYKILKNLLNNDNGDFIDISSLIDNDSHIKGTIRDLRERKFIKTKAYPDTPINKPNWFGTEPSEKPPKCKITSLGKDYLYKIDNNSKDFKLKRSEIILAVILVCFGLWNIFLQSNQSDLKDNLYSSSKSLDSLSVNHEILMKRYNLLLKVVDSLKDKRNQ